jgi:hypothetical protein
VHPAALRSSLIEDLNRLACAEAQDRLAPDPERAREALVRLRWIDPTELERCRREAWLDEQEAGLVARFLELTRERLTPIPRDVDPIAFTHADAGWQAVRERALELVAALDAFIDIGVPGWGHQYRPDPAPADRQGSG